MGGGGKNGEERKMTEGQAMKMGEVTQEEEGKRNKQQDAAKSMYKEGQRRKVERRQGWGLVS